MKSGIQNTPICWAIGVCMLACGVNASAQPAPLEFRNPPNLDSRYGLSTDPNNLSLSKASRGDEAVKLRITMTQGRFWNAKTGRYDTVNLRSYQGDRVDERAPFVSPLLEVRPGNTVRVSLDNQLPADPSCLQHEGDVNSPHCFNGTNLHAHGLWVNPEGNSDNVLISVNPGVQFEYEYNIPPDHPAGTFWYHTHRHGSTALQVSSGMAGALIVRGDRVPTPSKSGDLDTLLKPISGQRFAERVLVLQQIQYACRNADGSIKTDSDNTYQCDEGDVGEVDRHEGILDGPGNWRASGRYTSINGVQLPLFSGARVGQIERWRVIHGGIRDTVNIQFRRLQPNSAEPGALSPEQQASYIDQHCTGPVVPQHVVAADGLTLDRARVQDETVFQPGYRWDMLMAFPQSGLYCVIDTTVPAPATVSQMTHSRRLLGMVRVAGATSPDMANTTTWVRNELQRAATANMPANVRQKVRQELANGLALTSFVDHRTIAENEVTGQQKLNFHIDVATGRFMVDDAPFGSPESRVRELVLGNVDEWTLTSSLAGHPFHIHVNPFQVVRILDTNGKDVSAADAVDDVNGQVDPQYQGLKGAWKDTLFVKQGYTVVVRTRYQRYIGTFVLHCHILDHEDRGMMQLVRIGLPSGSGNPTVPAPLSMPAAVSSQSHH